ncbi:MAG TPA: hypothetical protein VNP37_13335 [Actinomycetospora sp.]|nr:hypothetical protein [Actinomycetospora sp.]
MGVPALPAPTTVTVGAAAGPVPPVGGTPAFRGTVVEGHVLDSRDAT